MRGSAYNDGPSFEFRAGDDNRHFDILSLAKESLDLGLWFLRTLVAVVGLPRTARAFLWKTSRVKKGERAVSLFGFERQGRLGAHAPSGP